MTILRNYPSTMPSATLDFAGSKKLDSRINFERASDATATPYPITGEASVSGAGQFVTYGQNVPRLLADGLLIEESRTNYVLTSGDVNTAANYELDSTKSAVSGVDPTGSNSTTICQITADNVTSSTPLIYGFANPGANHAASVYLKKGTHNFAGLWWNNIDGSSDAKVILNLTTGEQTANSPTFMSSVLVENAGNGWWRIGGLSSTGSMGTLSIRMFGSDGASADFDGTETIFAWGLQIEDGLSPTSYIPTTGSEVTRAADVATMPADYNVNQYTIINHDFGVAGGSDTLTVVGAGTTPAQRTAVYSDHLTQEEVSAVSGVKDEWWEWRVLGISFALPDAKTDGQVTIDWGDGSTSTLDDQTTGIPEHTFTSGSGYRTIKFRLDSGTYFQPSIQGDATEAPKIISVGPCPPSMKVYAYFAFKSCPNLETLDAGFAPIRFGNDMRDAFNGCSSLLDFPWIDTSEIENFSITWQSCSSLTSFPPLDTSSATSLGYAWSGCSSLKTFPYIDTSSVGDLQSAWRNCSALTSFPPINTSNVTNFNSTWSNAQNLTSFPLIDTSSGEDFTSCWNNCRALTSFPAIDTSQGDDFNSTWQNCIDLTSFPLLDTSNGLAFPRAWNGCNSLLSFPLLDTSQGEQFDFAWANCSSLTSFPLIDTSSALDFYKTWQGCSGLLSFPLLNTSQVTRFAGAWALCSNLASFPQINASSGTDFSGAWSTCSSLTSFPAITFSASATTFKNAWLNCSSLQDFPSGFFDSWTGPPDVQCFYQTWKGCSDLTPTSVEYILDSLALPGRPNAPAGSGSYVEIDIDYDTLAGVPYGGSVDGGGIIRLPDGVSQPASIVTLKSRGWTVNIDGTAQ